MSKTLEPEVEREIHRLFAQGYSVRDVGAMVERSRGVVVAVSKREAPPVPWDPPASRLSLADREEILVGLAAGATFTAIARRIGRAVSSVSREVASNGGRAAYRAGQAHDRARSRARRPKAAKLDHPRLNAQVTTWLEGWWSPEEIAERLRIEFPDDPMMRVSYETIYQSLFVQGRGELRRDLHRCLRSGRAHRRRRGRVESRGQITGKVMISERPAEIEDRAVPGHWESDLIIGQGGKSAVGTLVERTTRFTMLLHLPDGRDTDKVVEAMQRAIQTLPTTLFRTVTCDQGKEMAAHAKFTVSTGVAVYFCDPHCPWQRGTNENTNGLLRQYMPKGTDLSLLSAEDLDRFAASLNGRPRKTLGYKTPSEKLKELLATTT